MDLGRRVVTVFKADSALLIGTWFLSSLFIALTWAVTVSLVIEEKRQALESSIAESESIASIIAANLNELLGRGDLYASLSRRLLERTTTSAGLVRSRSVGDATYLGQTLFDADGVAVVGLPARRGDPVLRDLALRLLESASSDKGISRLTIGAPADPEQGGFWGIPVAVPVVDDSNRVLGVFTAYIDLGYVLRLYREVSLSTDSTIELRRSDGLELAELRDGMLAAGIRTTQDATGVLRFGSTVDSVQIRPERAEGHGPVGVYRQLEQYPVAVVVTRESGSILAALGTRHSNYFYRAGFASLGLICLGFVLVKLARRQTKLYQELRRSEQKNKELIEQLESEKALAVELASHDFLTRLPNRMMFHDHATAELARARRSRKYYALYFLDLDKFKSINDTLGHAIGDLLLKEVAARLRANLREYDLIARLGGDEFVVLVSELESTQRAAAIAQKLVEALSAPYLDMNGHLVETSPSVGISLFPDDGLDIDTLLARSDLAMYDAKRSGRGTYRFYDNALNNASSRKLELIPQMRPAVAANEFRLHYQMRFRLVDYRPVGLEALMRWEHPNYGMIFPGEFIPLAEEHDVIASLGNWAIDAACAQLAAWREAGVPLLPVAVNISARQLRDDRLVDVILSALARHEIHPGLLEVEVTESCFIDRPEVAHRVLKILHENGIKISLDDYGTGFSGLSHLKHLPIGAVKIDRSFIRDIRNDGSDAMIVASTISLSHGLGLTVVAEGVETTEQLVHLNAAGCDEVQGFYFHRPADAESVAEELHKHLSQAAPEATA